MVQAVIVGHFGLPPDGEVVLRTVDPEGEPVFTLHATSAYASNGRPEQTTLDVELLAASFDEAWQLGYHYAAFFAPVMALVANAPFGFADVRTAVDRSPGRRERVLRTSYQEPHDFHWFDRYREVAPDLFAAVGEATFASEHSGRLHRAMVHYAEALNSWSEAGSLTAVYSLCHSVELLAEVVAKRALSSSTLEKLAEAWGAGGETCDNCAHRVVTEGDLKAAARGSIVLQGDPEAKRAWNTVRNPLAHGYGDFPSMQRAAASVRRRLAELVRQSILDQLDLDDEIQQRLLSDPVAKPLQREAFQTTFESLLECDADGVWSPDDGWIGTSVDVAPGDLTYGPDGSIRGGENVRVTLNSDPPRGGGAIKGSGFGAAPGVKSTGEFTVTVRHKDGSTDTRSSSDPDWRDVERFDEPASEHADEDE